MPGAKGSGKKTTKPANAGKKAAVKAAKKAAGGKSPRKPSAPEKAAASKTAAPPPRRPPAANWFEIPAADFDRARTFYSAVLAQTLPVREWRGVKMAFIEGYPGGAVVAGEKYVPSASGALVYLNAGDDLSVMLSRVEPAGGHLELPKTMISPELGYYAVFADTEGNRVALHSMK